MTDKGQHNQSGDQPPPQSPRKKKRALEEKLQKIAKQPATKLTQHNVFTHFPKCPDCPICNQSKIARAHCRRKRRCNGDDLPRPKRFGDSITADHMILNEDDALRSEDYTSLVIYDRATRWMQAFPCKTKNAEESKQTQEVSLLMRGKSDTSLLRHHRVYVPP